MSSLNFNTVKSYVEEYDGLINENLANISNYLTTLKADISSEVTAALAMANPEPAITDTTQLDAAWWEENAVDLGWTKVNGWYYKYDEQSGKTYAYNPNHGNKDYKGSGHLKVYNGEYLGTGKAPRLYSECYCALFVNGSMDEVTRTHTCINAVNPVNGKADVPENGEKGTLTIVPYSPGNNDDYHRKVFGSSLFGDALLRSNGNETPTYRTVSGFSIGGQCAMDMCAKDEYAHYYNKIALIDVAPNPAFRYEGKAMDNLSGMEFDIVLNYNNTYGSGDDGSLNYINPTYGGPHLDKLASIPGATINLVLPPVEYDTVGTIGKLIAHANGLNLDNVNINTYDLPKDMVGYYDGTKFDNSGIRKSSHKQVHQYLYPAYISGFTEF